MPGVLAGMRKQSAIHCATLPAISSNPSGVRVRGSRPIGAAVWRNGSDCKMSSDSPHVYLRRPIPPAAYSHSMSLPPTPLFFRVNGKCFTSFTHYYFRGPRLMPGAKLPPAQTGSSSRIGAVHWRLSVFLKLPEPLPPVGMANSTVTARPVSPPNLEHYWGREVDMVEQSPCQHQPENATSSQRAPLRSGTHQSDPPRACVRPTWLSGFYDARLPLGLPLLPSTASNPCEKRRQ